MNLVELAQRIRKLRQQKDLTLQEAAARSGLTRSWLSKVENFRVTPSLPALADIAVALDVTLAQLVEGLDDRVPFVVVRSDERLVVERDANCNSTSETVYESLAHKHPGRSMDPFLLTVPAGETQRTAMGHDGEEFLMVLKGRVDFEYDGETYHLKEGDSLYFEATPQHRLLNPYKFVAHVLCVFLTQCKSPPFLPEQPTEN